MRVCEQTHALDPGTETKMKQKSKTKTNQLFDFITLLKSSNINYKRSHRSSCLGQITMKQQQQQQLQKNIEEGSEYYFI